MADLLRDAPALAAEAPAAYLRICFARGLVAVRVKRGPGGWGKTLEPRGTPRARRASMSQRRSSRPASRRPTGMSIRTSFADWMISVRDGEGLCTLPPSPTLPSRGEGVLCSPPSPPPSPARGEGALRSFPPGRTNFVCACSAARIHIYKVYSRRLPPHPPLKGARGIEKLVCRKHIWLTPLPFPSPSRGGGS